MRITCIQMDVAFGQVEENFRRAEGLIQQAMANKPDVVVLPETWNTGYFPKDSLQDLCDRELQQVKKRIGALARKFHVNIVAGSAANMRDGKCRNTAAVFDREGKCIAEYDKIHLFSPMEEDKYFSPGDRLCRFFLDGVPCGLILCYDLRFPELSRSLALNGVQVLFMSAQWPTQRINHMHALITARAIENQMFCVCCNACGTAGDTVYGGNSLLVDPQGQVLAVADGKVQILSAEADLSQLQKIRNSIHVFRDRRPELYQL